MKSSMRDSFIILEVVATIIIAVLLFRADRGSDTYPPTISVPQETVSYTQGTSDEALLAGVTAEDDVDGDVSASLVVSSISAAGEGPAIAVYEARDNSNNVAVMTRTINFVPDENAGFEGVPVSTEKVAVNIIMDDESGALTASESDISGANTAGQESQTAGDGVTDSSAGTSGDASGDTLSGSADEVLASYEEKNPEEYTGDDLEIIGKALRSESEAEISSLPAGSPKIGLLVHAIQQDVGTELNPLDLIASIDDAEDSIEYIFGQIHVEGNEGFTTDYPGKYVFRYYVIDSEGNYSNVARLYVLVR